MQNPRPNPLHASATPAPQQSSGSETGVAALQSALGALNSEQQVQVLARLPAHQLARALEKILKPGSADVADADLPEGVADERRSDKRTKTLRAAKIIYNNKMSVTYCQIRDISGTGCKISVESTFSVPQYFTLHIQNGDTVHECEVVWRRPDMMGVAFIG